jgi:hypothetical protein
MNKDLKNLEEAYQLINHKEKDIISEDANEGLGAGIVYLIAFGLPLVFDYFSKKYPELKEKFNEIKMDIKNNQQTKQDIKNYLQQSKQRRQEYKDKEQERIDLLGLKKR